MQLFPTVIESIDADMEMPTLYLEGVEQDPNTGWYGSRHLVTGTQFELRDRSQSLKIKVYEVREMEKFKSYTWSVSLTSATSVESSECQLKMLKRSELHLVLRMD